MARLIHGGGRISRGGPRRRERGSLTPASRAGERIADGVSAQVGPSAPGSHAGGGPPRGRAAAEAATAIPRSYGDNDGRARYSIRYRSGDHRGRAQRGDSLRAQRHLGPGQGRVASAGSLTASEWSLTRATPSTGEGVGHVITLRVTGTKPGFEPVAQESEPVGPVLRAVMRSSRPTIVGEPVFGQRLRVGELDWGADDVASATSGCATGCRWPGRRQGVPPGAVRSRPPDQRRGDRSAGRVRPGDGAVRAVPAGPHRRAGRVGAAASSPAFRGTTSG